MNIAVIGGGSIGLLVSNYLAKQHDVSLYVRRVEQQERINDHQIHLYKQSTPIRMTDVPAFLIEQLSNTYDCFIICVKQPHIADVLAAFQHSSITAPLLFFQNGMGHIELIQSLSQRVYVGVINHGAHRIADNQVDHLGEGSIKLASITGDPYELEQLQAALHQRAFPIEKVDDWEPLVKGKVLVNAVINPLTAMFDVPNGKVMTNKYIAFLAKKLCEETAAALQLPFNRSWENVVQTAYATKNNVSSMRADIQTKRPTELEAITGYVLKKANQELPYTNFVYHAVLALSQEGEHNHHEEYDR